MRDKRLSATPKNAGQAIVEYVLLLAMILGMGTIIVSGVNKGRDTLWKQIICDVSRACPTCQAPSSVEALLPNTKKCK